MVGVTKKIMETGMCVDYDEVKRITDNVYDTVRYAKEIHVTSEAGTDFVATMDPDLKWIPCSGVVEKKGEWDNLPSGEVFSAPKSLVGRLVVDGTVGDWIGTKYNGKMDYRETPLDITVEDKEGGGSFATEIKCDHDEMLEDFTEYLAGDPNASRVGELGIGTNYGIGTGTKVHKLRVRFAERDGIRYLLNVGSYCGSQRFTGGGYSGLRLLPEGTEITCRKCLP